MKVYMEGKNMQLYDSVKNSELIEFTNVQVGISFPDRCAHCIRDESPLFGYGAPGGATRFHTNGRNLATAHRSALCIPIIKSNSSLFTTFSHAELVISPPTRCLLCATDGGA